MDRKVLLRNIFTKTFWVFFFFCIFDLTMIKRKLRRGQRMGKERKGKKRQEERNEVRGKK